MNMKLLNLVILVSLLLVPLVSVQAETSPPLFLESYAHEREIEFDLPQALQNVQSQSVTVGEPGLAFRLVDTFGVPGEPYLVDGQHINGPNGIFIDGDDNLFIAETRGDRVLQFNSTAQLTLTIGQAGQPWHHDAYLAQPENVAVDSDGNIWIIFNQVVKKFDTNGELLFMYPEENPWESGNSNERFDSPRGIAFDESGRVFISDTFNHRVQIFADTGATLEHVYTIGAGVPASDNTGFDQPHKIDFDDTGRLYVVDTANYRIQRCAKSTSPENWTCETFYGVTGEEGDDLTHMGWASAITVNDDDVYIGDGTNYRVLKCDLSGACAHFAGTNGGRGWDNDKFWWTGGVAVDSSGNVYVSDFDNHRIQKFDSGGNYIGTIGTTRQPYLVDNIRMNKPWGIAVAQNGDLFVGESAGWQLLKMDSSGVRLWSVGEAGVYGYDNAHFGDYWAGLEGNMVTTSDGYVYMPDTGNNRIQIFNAATGAYVATWGEWGTGNSQFQCPQTVAINPVNQDILVADTCNSRVQVYTHQRFYKTTIGITEELGDSNAHLNSPRGVAVAPDGIVYIADTDNERVQKCVWGGSNYACSTFVGETGVHSRSFEHLHPIAVAVDSSGQVYVADEWNNRIQVFDSNGAYLTTIGGGWGNRSGELIGPSGIAIDTEGNVYVTDRDNHRIQKFVPGVPGWRQTNVNGFGEIENYAIESLEVFDNTLYAGAANYTDGATIWRSTDGVSWTIVTEPGFDPGYGNTNGVIFDMLEFNNQIYAGTGWWVEDGIGGQIWRSSTGDSDSWSMIEGNGFGKTENSGVVKLAEFNNMIYAITFNIDSGLEIWRSPSGDNGSWSTVVTDGFARGAENLIATGMTVFDGQLYVAVEATEGTGAQIWRSTTGDSGSWLQVNVDGFGDTNNYQTGGFAIHDGYLYIGTRNNVTGAQIWRSLDGNTWTQMVSNGFGKPENLKVESLTSLNGALFAKTYNNTSGVEIWRSIDGINWAQVGLSGISNQTILWNAAAEFQGQLFLGIASGDTGGQIWRMVGSFAKAAPADGATDMTLSPMLSWNQLVGATSYEYCYSSAPGPCAKWNSVGSDTSVTLNGLAPNYTYYWQVRAVDSGGTTEADGGTWWSFTTTAASACTWPPYTPPAAPTFGDVPMDVGHWSWVERLANSSITAGCGAGNYCPFNEVNRAQMAIFLLRGKHCGSSYTPPAIGDSTGFGDVPLDATYAPWVKQLAAEGITAGCGGGNFCPLQVVNRAQMAIFLLRAKHGATYSPPAVGATTGFGDVPLAVSYAPWVKQLAAEGVTAGCGSGNFCPLQNVNRAQMATFLVRAFGLP